MSLTLSFGDAIALALANDAGVQSLLHAFDDPSWPADVLDHPRVFDTSPSSGFLPPYITIGRTVAGRPTRQGGGAAFGSERAEIGSKTLHCWMPGHEQRPALQLWEAVRRALAGADVTPDDSSAGIVLLRCRSHLTTTLVDPSGKAHQAVVEVTGILRGSA